MEAAVLEQQSKGYCSDLFLDRVRRSYKLALAISNDHHGRMWAELDQRRAPIHNALLADSNDDLRTIFANPAATDLFRGIDDLGRNLMGRTPPPETLLYGFRLGNRTLKEVLEIAAKRLFDLLPASLQNAQLPFPNFPGEMGLQTPTGIATCRAIQGIYQASLIQSALLACNNKSVIEIGPGIGRAAFYAHQLGISDYTTVDLPLGIVAQACFLGAALGPEKLWMYGDEQTAEGRIRLITAGQKPEKMYGVAFNSDSMTEMSLPAALDYVKWLAQHCERFVSINRRDNLFVVSDIAAKWFTLAHRRPYPMEHPHPSERPDYTEEVFVPRESPGLMAWHRIAWHIAKLSAKRGPKRTIHSIYQRTKSRLGRYAARV